FAFVLHFGDVGVGESSWFYAIVAATEDDMYPLARGAARRARAVASGCASFLCGHCGSRFATATHETDHERRDPHEQSHESNTGERPPRHSPSEIAAPVCFERGQGDTVGGRKGGLDRLAARESRDCPFERQPTVVRGQVPHPVARLELGKRSAR